MKAYTHLKTCRQIYTAHYLLQPQINQSKYPATGKWISKMCYNHTKEFWLATKRNELIIHAITCMNIKNIMVSQRRQIQDFTFYAISRKDKFIDTESK